MSAPVTTKAGRTREALRRAAIGHFREHGFEAASVPAIAAEVGVTERTFYRHFATKDEVLFIDVTATLAWFRPSLDAQLARDQDLIAAVLHALTAPPFDPRVMLEIARLRVELLSPTRIERSLREAQGALARDIREALAARGDDGIGGAVRAEATAGAVLAALLDWTGRSAARLGELQSLIVSALEETRPIVESTPARYAS